MGVNNSKSVMTFEAIDKFSKTFDKLLMKQKKVEKFGIMASKSPKMMSSAFGKLENDIDMTGAEVKKFSKESIKAGKQVNKAFSPSHHKKALTNVQQLEKATAKFNTGMLSTSFAKFRAGVPILKNLDITTKKGKLSMSMLNREIRKMSPEKGQQILYQMNRFNSQVKQASSGQRQFNMDLLSGMFFFMSLSMAMQTFLSPAQEAAGIWQIMRDYLTILFMPAAMWVLDWIIKAGDYLMDLFYKADGTLSFWGKLGNYAMLAAGIVTKALSMIFMTVLGFGGLGWLWQGIVMGFSFLGINITKTGKLFKLFSGLFSKFGSVFSKVSKILIGGFKGWMEKIRLLIFNGKALRKGFTSALGPIGSLLKWVGAKMLGLSATIARAAIAIGSKLIVAFLSPAGVILSLIAIISMFYLAVKHNIGGAGEFALKFRRSVYEMVKGIGEAFTKIPGFDLFLKATGREFDLTWIDNQIKTATTDLKKLEEAGQGTWKGAFSSEYEAMKGRFSELTGYGIEKGGTTTNVVNEITVINNNDISSDVDVEKIKYETSEEMKRLLESEVR